MNTGVMSIMSRIITINCVVSLLWPLIFLNFTDARNRILNCMIRDGENKIHLELQKTEQWLANNNLPIWTSSIQEAKDSQHGDSVEYVRKIDFMKQNIGRFTLYQDRDKSAAVVYFEETNILIGVVDTRYLIIGLPLGECHKGHHVGGEYVGRLGWSGATNLHGDLKPLDLSMRRVGQNTASASRASTFSTAEDESHTTLYPEIMFFIPYAVTKIAKDTHRDDYLTVLVLHYIVYFNAIDMLLSKLSTHDIKIHLNLAGIVIEDQENGLSFLRHMNENYPQGFRRNVRHVDAIGTLLSFNNYIIPNNDLFTQDSFDFYFIATGNNMWSTVLRGETAGVSILYDMYEQKRNGMRNILMPGVIVRNTYGYEYVTPSHEIAHLMTIGHDSMRKGYRSGVTQCYAIMQQVNNFCPDCLKWSDESIKDLEKYVKYDRNRCYLLNEPRSLHPYGARMMTLSPADQCRCYGLEPLTSYYFADFSKIMPSNFCNANLICGTAAKDGPLPPPVDGTPCFNKGVCWNRVCQPIQMYSEF